MLHRLGAAGLLAASGSGGIMLSEHGQWHAREMVPAAPADRDLSRTGRGDERDEVHDEAEALQHAASDLLIERIDAVLGHPRRHPHGDPIPQPTADYIEDWSPALAGVAGVSCSGWTGLVTKTAPPCSILLGLGVRPGVVLRVLDREPFGGPLWVEVGGQRHAMGIPLAQLVHGVVPS